VLSALRSRFRLRFVLVFVVVAGVSCGTLAASTFVLASHYRRRSFTDRAVREAQLHVGLAPQPLTPAVAREAALLFDRAGGEDVVVVTADGSVFGSSGLGLADIPQALRRHARAAVVQSASTRVHGRRALVVKRSTDGAQWFFVFDEADLNDGLGQLGEVLAAGWLLVVVAAALVGTAVARRTLRPVKAAGDAALAIAEGLLDTRLPVGPDDEFGRLARYFNEMAAALEAKILALSEAHERELRFTANVAHELRTPLAAAVNAAAVVESRLHEVPESVRRPIELVIGDVHRLRRLALDLLELARLDAGQEEVANEVLSLPALVEAVRRTGGWDDVIEVNAEPLWVVADRRRLERVVTNLFSNAIEHGASPIAATIFSDGDHGVLELHDAGPGIPVEQRDAVFERFFKADGARSGAGVGLGLSIAAQHTKAMSGTLSVDPSEARGATFRLRLPASR
jgi:signal transduction histidine kinase